jgi:hypothetical protein
MLNPALRLEVLRTRTEIQFNLRILRVLLVLNHDMMAILSCVYAFNLFFKLPMVWSGTFFQAQCGETALIRAAQSGRTDCVRLLVQRGPNNDTQDNVRSSYFAC